MQTRMRFGRFLLQPLSFFLLVAPFLCGQAIQRTVHLGQEDQRHATHVAAVGDGSVWVVSEAGDHERGLGDLLITRLDASGRRFFETRFGGSRYEFAEGIATGSDGSLVIAGRTGSADLPTHNALQPDPPESKSGHAFLVKLGPNGDIRFSTYFAAGRTSISGVGVDDAGNIVFGGGTDATDFPTTEGAFQTAAAVRLGPAGRLNAGFVAAISPGGDRLLYSTLLGGTNGSSEISAIAVTATGEAVVTGLTSASDFPISADAVQTDFRGVPDHAYVPFVARFNAQASALVYATYLGGGAGGPLSLGLDYPRKIAVDREGAAYVVCRSRSRDFPITEDAFQRERAAPIPDDYPFTPAGLDLTLTKLNPTGTRLEYSTFLGGAGSESVAAVTVDEAGRISLTGHTSSPDFPISGTGFDRGSNFVTTFNPDGSLFSSSLLPSGVSGTDMAENNGSLHLLSSRNLLSLYDPTPSDSPQIIGLTNAALWKLDWKVAPGQLISIYGRGIGPEEPVSLELDESGRVPVELGGVRVLVNGVPAPVLYAQRDQVNAIVPFDRLLVRGAGIRIEYQGRVIWVPLELTVAESNPAVFTWDGHWAAALNQDGTVNSEENPAEPGSVVALFATGAGHMSPEPEDGTLAEPPYARANYLISVTIPPPQGRSLARALEVTYAGAAPGLVAGVIQVNVRLPEEPPRFNGHALDLRIGEAESPTVAVWVRSR